MTASTARLNTEQDITVKGGGFKHTFVHPDCVNQRMDDELAGALNTSTVYIHS